MQVTDEMVEAACNAFMETNDLLGAQMRAALTAALAKAWRPIESGPRDGRHVMLAMADDEYVGQGYYDVDSGNWYPPLQNSHEWPDMKMYPTHWMPLPEPPATKEGGER